MDKKFVALAAGMLSLLGFASAQPAISGTTAGFVGSIVGFLGGIFEYYFGIPLAERNMLSTFAVIGAFWYALYIGLEASLDKLGWKEYFTGEASYGQEGSKWRLIVFSLLIFAVFMGSQLFTPIILLLRDSLVLTIAAAAVMIIIGAAKFTWSGGRGAMNKMEAKGKEINAEATEDLANAEEEAQEAEQLMEDVIRKGKGIKELKDELDAALRSGDLQNTEHDMEELIVMVENLEEELEGLEAEVEDAVKRLVEIGSLEVKNESDIYDELKDAQTDLKRVRDDLEKMRNYSRSSASRVSRSDLESHIGGDIEHMAKDLKEVQNALQREREAFRVIHEEEELESFLENVREKMENELGFLKKGNYSDLTQEAQELANQVKQTDPDEWERVKREVEQAERLQDTFANILRKWRNIDEKLEEAEEQTSRLENEEGKHWKYIDNYIEPLLGEIEKELESKGVREIFERVGAGAQADKIRSGVDNLVTEIETLEKRMS